MSTPSHVVNTAEPQDNTIEFLASNQFLYDRIKMGIDLHPPDGDLLKFQAIAKTIDKDRYFTIYGCQSCVVALVRFVYENWKPEVEPEVIKHATFPKVKDNGKA